MHTLIQPYQMKKQILKISYPICLTLNVGIYTKALTKRWIEDDQDLDAMYRVNCGDKITIWCEGCLSKHLPEPPSKSGHKRKACALLHVQCVSKEQSIPAIKLQVREFASP